ncbi:ATP-binding protein [Rhodococcus koreensis]|uniref:ATP-binding protein n=1 Tax=Rhodococcus koreensis TaxID=99653 RepID=UPI001981FE01|nr:LuxR C-terminal-related transcriptional regulator [Rhodococcus koreensis]QSE77719.1 LuxR family transcriptional regulator [Rhodococcus koreensis]
MSLAIGDRTAHLPLELTSFVGRRAELAEAKRLLGAHRLVTVTGIGGVGKTRLALRVAADIAHTFTGGVRLIELGEIHSAGKLTATIAESLAPRIATPSLDDLIELLATQRPLLVFDNCEHLVDDVAVAVGKLLRVCPDLRILATSRECLGIGGEATLALRPLATPDCHLRSSLSGLPSYDAIALFADRASAAVPGFGITEDNQFAVVKICQRLEGLPLPIELAARRLRALSTQQILEHLDDLCRFLTLGSRGAPARQQSLRSSLDWSYDLCSAAERCLWEVLSIFERGFELDAAEVACAGYATADELLDVVTSLINKSIIIAEETRGLVRYRMLATVRDYGLDKLRATDRHTPVLHRYRDWFVKLALHADACWLGPRQIDLIDRLDRERANLYAVMSACLDDPRDAPCGLRMGIALRRLWMNRGLLDEGRHWLSQGRAQQISSSSTAHVAALCAESTLAGLQGRPHEAFDLLAAARRSATLSADPGAGQLVLPAEAEVSLATDDATTAAALFEITLEAIGESGDATARLEALTGLGRALGRNGDYENAATCFDEALAISDAHGESVNRAVAHTALAAISETDAPTRTAHHLELALHLTRQLRNPILAADLLRIAAVLASDCHTERAAVLFEAAEAWQHRVGRTNTRATEDPGDARARITLRLGEREYSQAQQRGRRFSLDQAVAYALGEPPDRDERCTRSVDVLTPREWQVAQLIRQGLTNKAIAETLVISQRTAQGHVERILNKLGFTSRVHVAAWLTERDAVEAGTALEVGRRGR